MGQKKEKGVSLRILASRRRVKAIESVEVEPDVTRVETNDDVY